MIFFLSQNANQGVIKGVKSKYDLWIINAASASSMFPLTSVNNSKSEA